MLKMKAMWKLQTRTSFSCKISALTTYVLVSTGVFNSRRKLLAITNILLRLPDPRYHKTLGKKKHGIYTFFPVTIKLFHSPLYAICWFSPVLTDQFFTKLTASCGVKQSSVTTSVYVRVHYPTFSNTCYHGSLYQPFNTFSPAMFFLREQYGFCHIQKSYVTTNLATVLITVHLS